jgi:hypothetical protein
MTVINHALDPVLICFPLKIAQSMVVMAPFINKSRDFCDAKYVTGTCGEKIAFLYFNQNKLSFLIILEISVMIKVN